MKAGDRVRVRPGTGTAEMVAIYDAGTGTVQSMTTDPDGESLVVELDSGETVWSLSPKDWEVIA